MARPTAYGSGHREHDRKMQKVQQRISRRFEGYLRDFFEAVGELVQFHPTLPNKKEPDFLLRDSEGNTCYADAKVYYSSREPHAYYEPQLINALAAQESIDGLQVRLEYLGGEMRSSPSESDLEAIRNWLGGIDREMVKAVSVDLTVYQEDSETVDEIFEFQGARYLATPKAVPDNLLPQSLVSSVSWSGSYTIDPDRVYGLESRVQSAAETYTAGILNGLPLVVISLDFTSDTLDSEIYGTHYISINTDTGKPIDSGLNGMGLWRDSTGPKQDLAHVQAVWFWQRQAKKRPTLYTNPDVEELQLPTSLFNYRYYKREEDHGGKIHLRLGDGGAVYGDYIAHLWDEYVDRSRELHGEAVRDLINREPTENSDGNAAR